MKNSVTLFLMENVLLILLFVLSLHQCTKLPEIKSYYDIYPAQDIFTADCEDALDIFALSSSNYTLCVLRNAHPIHMCQNCVDSYIALTNDYTNILTLEINGTKCKDKLINLDRLQIVESTFNGMKNLWDRGLCNKCFQWDNNTATLSNNTMMFITYFNKTKDCINTHVHTNNNTEEICKACMNDYLQLNSFYQSLKGYSETTGICMDIVDSMNATRSIWSDVLNCCKLRKTPEAIFLMCTALLSLLPVLFYFATRIFASETPKIQVIGQHQFEDADDCQDNPPPSTSQVS